MNIDTDAVIAAARLLYETDGDKEPETEVRLDEALFPLSTNEKVFVHFACELLEGKPCGFGSNNPEAVRWSREIARRLGFTAGESEETDRGTVIHFEPPRLQ